MPSYLNALTDAGVHVVTVNDYLAQTRIRVEGTNPHFLGIGGGRILSQMDPAERRRAYQDDTSPMAPTTRFGFDYLRDNMALSLEDCVQREHHYPSSTRSTRS